MSSSDIQSLSGLEKQIVERAKRRKLDCIGRAASDFLDILREEGVDISSTTIEVKAYGNGYVKVPIYRFFDHFEKQVVDADEERIKDRAIKDFMRTVERTRQSYEEGQD